MMKDKKWIACFSRTGSELKRLIDTDGIKPPDVIITSNREMYFKGVCDESLHMYANKKFFDEALKRACECLNCTNDDVVVTLHGWMYIISEATCNEYRIYNGHPGLITKYPELKGKDPQERAFASVMRGEHTQYGGVIHEVIPAVDDGKVLLEFAYNDVDCYTAERRAIAEARPFHLVYPEVMQQFNDTLADGMYDLWRSFLTSNSIK